MKKELLSRRWNVSVSAWKRINLYAPVTIWVYLAYNCVTKNLDHPAHSRDVAPGAYHPFLAVKQTLADHKFKDDRKFQKVDGWPQKTRTVVNKDWIHFPRYDKRFISCLNSIQLDMNCLSRNEKFTPACETTWLRILTNSDIAENCGLLQCDAVTLGRVSKRFEGK
jgi:hypothetical protein